MSGRATNLAAAALAGLAVVGAAAIFLLPKRGSSSPSSSSSSSSSSKPAARAKRRQHRRAVQNNTRGPKTRTLAGVEGVELDPEAATADADACNLTAEEIRAVEGGIKLITPQTAEEVEAALAKQKVIADEDRERYETTAGALWNKFYTTNEDRFYKDRHYIREVWAEYLMIPDRDTILLEVGCGAGNTIYPLLRANPRLTAHACDFSKRAVELVKERDEFADFEKQGRVSSFQCDIVKEGPANHLGPQSVDVITCVFVLGAVKPADFRVAIANMARALRPGGHILFRDHGRHDQAQIRFSHKLGDNYYVRRNDGTLSYYFEIDEVRDLFGGEGFEILECDYVEKHIINRKKGMAMRRRWIQGVFKLKE